MLLSKNIFFLLKSHKNTYDHNSNLFAKITQLNGKPQFYFYCLIICNALSW